jgi:hypothetical protein
MMTVDSTGVAVHSVDNGMVTVTIRVPEQFFEYELPTTYWKLVEKEVAKGLGNYGDFFDTWLSDTHPEKELFGPDGNQLPIWES